MLTNVLGREEEQDTLIAADDDSNGLRENFLFFLLFAIMIQHLTDDVSGSISSSLIFSSQFKEEEKPATSIVHSTADKEDGGTKLTFTEGGLLSQLIGWLDINEIRKSH
jgi:hypothetical protein